MRIGDDIWWWWLIQLVFYGVLWTLGAWHLHRVGLWRWIRRWVAKGVWGLSEWSGIPLGRATPYVFGWMIGATDMGRVVRDHAGRTLARAEYVWCRQCGVAYVLAGTTFECVVVQHRKYPRFQPPCKHWITQRVGQKRGYVQLPFGGGSGGHIVVPDTFAKCVWDFRVGVVLFPPYDAPKGKSSVVFKETDDVDD